MPSGTGTVSVSGKLQNRTSTTTITMDCLHTRIPYASWRLWVFQRLFSPSLDSRLLSRRGISTSPDHNPQEPDTDTTKNERPSDLLPQSPLATHRTENERKKRPAPEDLHDLSLNPWATALASPIRMCVATRARLPKAFLGEWGLVQRAGTNDDREKLWLMPVGLLRDELSQQQAPQITSPISRPLRFLRMRVVDRLPMLQRVTEPLFRAAGGKKSAIMKLMPHRWRYPFGPIASREERQMIWRQDMPEFFLEHMRKVTVKELRRASEAHREEVNAMSRVWTVVRVGVDSENALVEGLSRIEGIERMECGAVVVMGQEPLEQPEESRLPEYITLPQVQSRVPVFDLRVLLSNSDREALREFDSRFQAPALFLRPGDPETVMTVQALWRLMGFLRP